MSLSLPDRPNIQQLKKQAKDLLKAHKKGDTSVCEVLSRMHRFSESTEQEILGSSVSLQETQYALALAYGFEDWNALKAHVESSRSASEIPADESVDESPGTGKGEDVKEDDTDIRTEVDSPVVELVNKIILDAHAHNASDIHIEPYPGENPTYVRFRVDGNMYLHLTIPHDLRHAVVSRIKIMSDLNIAERQRPQDGKIRFKRFGGKDIELRVATVPTQGGLEAVTLRILASGEPILLDNLGLTAPNLENVVRCITQPYGLIFVCGPTGAGKTTTLHAMLAHINTPERKIWTAEDPVEITQRGLSQVQVKPKIGFDFAAALRSFLRSDPDVIMVGEMRDADTTNTGVEASLTGHLVLSTLHTSDSPESITRLLEMGIDPFNLSDAILCVLSQRLTRSLCMSCKESYHPTREEYDELVREYGPAGIGALPGIPYTDDLTLYRSNGCPVCNSTGYSGRIALHELLMGTDEVKKLIRHAAQTEEIRHQAAKDGMASLKQDGIRKVLDGHCDMLQVRRAIAR